MTFNNVRLCGRIWDGKDKRVLESADGIKKLSKQSDLVIVVDILSCKMRKICQDFFLNFSMNFPIKATQKGVMSSSGTVLQDGYLGGQAHLEIWVDRSTIDLCLGLKWTVADSVREPCLEGIHCRGDTGES